VLALRDLFQVVYDIKQKEKAAGGATSQAASANLQNLEQVELMLFTMLYYF
jgi:hypothetical protein